MAIVKMSKFRLTVFDQEEEPLLRELQAFDIVHFNDLKKEATIQEEGLHPEDIGVAESDIEEKLERVSQAISLLEPYESLKKGAAKTSTSVTYRELVQAKADRERENQIRLIRDQASKIRQIEEQVRAADDKKSELSHWLGLDFPLENLAKTTTVQVRTGSIPKKWAEEFKKQVALQTTGTYVEYVSADAMNQYILLIDNGTDAALSELLRDSGFVAIPLSGERSAAGQIEELAEQQNRLRDALANAKTAMSELAQRCLMPLRLEFERLSNQRKRIQARENFLSTQYLRFLEGYVPTESETAFREAVQRGIASGVYELELHPADKYDEDTPIMLKNGAVVRPFESIVETYSLPKYSEADPTPLMVPWYLLFFGLMVGDFGYGLVLFFGTLIGLKTLPLKESMANMFRFFFLLSIPTMLAGLAFGSFFGGLIPLPSLIDPTKNYMPMIIFSVVIGLVNVVAGLGIKAWMNLRDRKPLDAVYDVLFWYMALLGAIVFGGGGMLGFPAIVSQIAMVVMVLGMVGIVLFSARENKGFTRYTWGLYNLYGITSYVGDLVSYTRIAALMLSGAFIGYAVNLISQMLFGAGIGGSIGGILVLVVFHAFNLFLSGLSGYVHSMRLIYVEFFGKFYEGGGVPFSRFRSESKYVEVK